MDEWIKKYLYIMEYHSALKKSKTKNKGNLAVYDSMYEFGGYYAK